ncbi:hypothetical protein [Streptomyces sp. NBC_01465]|uniref:hypothetical protein n=1 Tax=Streptomyces sp. NBC_01465 TaxID=2903878 RepID=UPI002E30598A|nr:hypothetical protein [Streptomyces sp. NBC_01465]
MARLIPLIILALVVYSWLKNKKRLDPEKFGVKSSAPAQSARSRELGFLPADQLDTERAAPADPALAAALTAARAGDWQPAAALLVATGADWERRAAFVSSLGSAGAKDDAWLVAWESARPDDPDAAVVRADTTVSVAGALRGSATAKKTTQEQFDGFHRMMRQARSEIARAAELNPTDPTPAISEIWVALALGYPHEEMRRLWAQITARAPYHYSAHYSALQYWCQKWRGSVELGTDFAAHAAATAPQGSLLTALPLICWYEHESFGHTSRGYGSPEVAALVDALAADVAAASEDHPRLREVRLLLAWYLVKLERHEAALEQFLLVDGYVGGFPWSYYGDTAKTYVKARERTVRATA